MKPVVTPPAAPDRPADVPDPAAPAGVAGAVPVRRPRPGSPARAGQPAAPADRSWLLPLPGFLLLAVLSFPPLIYALYLSAVNVDSSQPSRAVQFVGLHNYWEILTGEAGRLAILHTLMISFGSTLLALVVGCGIAYLLFAYAGRLSTLLTVLILVPMSVSPVAMALMFSLILNPLYGPVPQVVHALGGPLVAVTASPAGALLTIIFVQCWQWSPLAVVLLLGGMQGLPESYFEAAAMDGATRWHMFWHIILPLLRPVLAVTALFEFILCSQLFAGAELLTNGGPGSATTDLSFFIYKIGIADSSLISLSAAAGIVALVGAILFARLWLRLSRWDQSIQ